MHFRPADFSRVARDGYALADAIVEHGECARLADAIVRYAAEHALPLIERTCSDRALRYSVIDGAAIAQSLPEVAAIFEEMRRALATASGRDVVPLADARAAINVNITAPGGEYRWHYDRNPLTAIVYLNCVEGGDIELLPRYRLFLGRLRHSKLQRFIDCVLRWRWMRAIAAEPVVVSPAGGRVVVMNGSRCLHSVRRVERGTRIALVFAYDYAGDASCSAASDLDRYLYTGEAMPRRDPNYVA
jgi:hypothetical protein